MKKEVEKPTVEDVMALRVLVRAREDFQGQRKRMDNRIGRKADGGEQDIAARPFRPDDLASFGAIADASREQEEGIEKALKKALKRFPIYNEYLANVDGIGTISAAHIISTIDIAKATTVSKIWQYAGLNPGMVTGKKAVKKADYKPSMGTIVAEYDPKPGMEASVLVATDTLIRGDKLTPGFVAPFNKDLRTALVGVMADGFIMSGVRWPEVDEEEYNSLPENARRIKDKKFQSLSIKQGSYAKFYFDYKNRLANEEGWKDESDGHRDRAAKRYMVKMFLKDLYVAWRTIEGLDVREPYQVEYLGHKHVA